jgi:Trp operon repressor
LLKALADLRNKDQKFDKLIKLVSKAFKTQNLKLLKRLVSFVTKDNDKTWEGVMSAVAATRDTKLERGLLQMAEDMTLLRNRLQRLVEDVESNGWGETKSYG